jgi:ABC-2 type transport system ATP-binding protein
LCKLRKVTDSDKKAQGWFEFFSLQDFGNEMIETYSHGMRQKLTFIAALIHEPSVFVVDEPMVGLDPKAAKQVRELLADYARKGKTVLLTTHSMEVAQAVAHKVILVNKGQIVAQGDMAALRSQVGNQDADLEAIFLRLTEEEAKDKELVLS